MMLHRLVPFAALAPLLLLGACGGMNRAVTTLPTTFDDLGRKTSAFRGEKAEMNREASREEAR